ncbi:MAG: biotin transporter BioY [Bradyrhizobiaceae bacterium]|nr:biotin transporter BioY [Bradyrhizobiaceae bacterium]
MQAYKARATLISALWPAEARATLVRNVVLALGGTVLLWLSAKINVPFYPVPLSMQTFVVLAIGAAYGWRLGAATILLYLAEGAAGLPVFAGTPEKGIGLAYMMGPTGGYLIGFVAGAALVGWLCERGWDRSFISLTAAMFLGHVALFVFGVAWLSSLIGFEKAWVAGVAPFYVATVLKTLLAAACIKGGWKLAEGRL